MHGQGRCEFGGVILGVKFLHMDVFHHRTSVCICMCGGLYGNNCIIHSLIVGMGVSGNFVPLRKRLCFGWGGTFVDDGEKSASSIPMLLQNDSTGKSVDS